jgi:hypothetical protein
MRADFALVDAWIWRTSQSAVMRQRTYRLAGGRNDVDPAREPERRAMIDNLATMQHRETRLVGSGFPVGWDQAIESTSRSLKQPYFSLAQDAGTTGIGIGGPGYPGHPSHTTRHAGPHRAVGGVEVVA